MELNAQDIWNGVCGDLSVSMSPAGFISWIKPCHIKTVTPLNEDRIIVELASPSGFHRKTVDEKYYKDIKSAIEKISHKKCELALIVEEVTLLQKKERTKAQEEKVGESEKLFSSPGEVVRDLGNLNPRFMFENYVVGGSNRLAFAASKSVAESPGTRHNPLFIYGGVGVGKTHLMHAIGHELIKRGVGKVVYLSSEQFTNDLVYSFRSKMTDAFKKKYRQVGALLIDDVQFFGGKESTQEEFFHTFNELTNKQVQVVLSADKKPQDIEGLEDRLVSRFLGGMMVDIGVPDYEMKVAILRQKATLYNVEVNDDVYDLIAASSIANARELEGMFTRVATEASLGDGIITKEIAQKNLGLPAKSLGKKKIRPMQVISVTAKYFGFRNKDLLGPSRKADLVKARHIAMYIMRDVMQEQLVKVGNALGGRDHTTIIHGSEKIKALMINDSEIRSCVMAIQRALYT